jgi:hypothetical protein
MEKVLQWFGVMTVKEVFLILASVSFVMAAIPFLRQIRVFIRYILGERCPVIHEFSYSFSGNPILGNTQSRRSARDVKSDIFLIGTRLHLHWKVSGARKIDLDPVGRDLKGDTATMVIDSTHRCFKLKAYGFFGSMAESMLDIPKENYRFIRTQPFSDDTHLFREFPLLSIRPLTNKLPDTRSMGKRLPLTGLMIVLDNVYLRHNGRPDLNALVYPSLLRTKLYRRLDEARLLKGLHFSPGRYDEAVKQVKRNFNQTKP